MSDEVEIRGYRLRLDRAYDPTNHVWVLVIDAERVRVGMDPLGVETAGTLAQLALMPEGTEVRRGEAFGSMEAAKFVGPLTAPVSGVIVARNDAVQADPGIVERDPLGEGWLVELVPFDLDTEMASLVEGEDRVIAWFEGKIDEYREKGVLAE